MTVLQVNSCVLHTTPNSSHFKQQLFSGFMLVYENLQISPSLSASVFMEQNQR